MSKAGYVDGRWIGAALRLRKDAEQSRLLSETATAQFLAMSPSEFCRRSKELEDKLGLPKRHPILKRRDRVALEIWLDQIFGVTRKAANVSDLVRQRMGELRDGERAHQALPHP